MRRRRERGSTENLCSGGDREISGTEDTLLATGSPVEAEDEWVGVVVSGKDLHYHWIQAEAYLQ